jgi:hypothetical protein
MHSVGVAVLHAEGQTNRQGEALTLFSHANALNKALRLRVLQVALDEAQSWDLVHMVINSEVPYQSDSSLLIKGLCSLEFLVFFYKINQKDATIFQVYYLTLFVAEHVSGVIPPIIRSIQLHPQCLVLHTLQVEGCSVVGRARPRPTTLHPSTCNVCKTRG